MKTQTSDTSGLRLFFVQTDKIQPEAICLKKILLIFTPMWKTILTLLTFSKPKHRQRLPPKRIRYFRSFMMTGVLTKLISGKQAHFWRNVVCELTHLLCFVNRDMINLMNSLWVSSNAAACGPVMRAQRDALHGCRSRLCNAPYVIFW
jgi:hypothetical protein